MTQYERQDIEKILAFELAKENELWIENLYSLGNTYLVGGHENTLVLNEDTCEVFKSNNLANSKNLISNLFESITIHNRIFPDTAYEFVGFTGIDNGSSKPPYIEVVFKQRFIPGTTKAEPDEIKSFMEALGFEQRTPVSYYNGKYLISDLHPRNVLKDAYCNIFVVDAEFLEVSETLLV